LKTIPFINQETCIGCGICVDVCPNGVFVMCCDKAVVMHPEKCNGCDICIENCPVDAITMKWSDL